MSKTFTIYCEVLRETVAAILVNEGDEEIWLPKSQLEDWPEPGESGEIEVPVWLAEEKGLV